jgi:tetratricopeptide (TPR) repeat protein
MWAVLPRLSESVAWISGRTDVFATTGILSALLLWDERWSRLLATALLLTLALFCKETAFAGVVVVCCLEVSQFRSRPRHRTLARLSCVALPVLAWLLLKASVSGILPAGYGHQTTRTRILTIFEAIGRYTSMIVDWLRPRAEIGIMGEPDLRYAIFGMVVFVAVVCLLFWLWPRLTTWPRALLLGTFTAIAPVLHVAQLTIDVNAADRFLYIPLALATLTFAAAVPFDSSRIAQIAAGLVMLSSMSVTFSRATVWTDPLTLWSNEYQMSAGTCRTCRRELTRIQSEAGDFVPALRMVQSLLRDSMVHQNSPALAALDMAVLYNKLGEHERAKRLLYYLVKEQPGIPGFWRELAASQAALYDYDAAEASAKHALKIMHGYEGAQSALRVITKLRLQVTRLKDPTASDFERAQFYESSGRLKDAEPIWLSLLAKNPSENEAEAALDFVANFGSSSATSAAFEQHRELLNKFPYWALQIGDKYNLHQRLVSLRLVP